MLLDSAELYVPGLDRPGRLAHRWLLTKTRLTNVSAVTGQDTL